MKFFLSILLTFAVLTTQAQDIQLTVIGNVQGSPAAMNLTELSSIYKGERLRWNNGTKIILAMLKFNTEVGTAVCHKVYKLSSDKAKILLVGLNFAGKMDSPYFCETALELEQYVSENPGAIGILANPETYPNVRSITIDGKKTF